MSSSRISTSSALAANTSTLDDDVLMSKEHKDIVREFRDQLVDNMYPDDLLNSLQASRVLSHRESSRIKEKGSAEAMNEALLDILIRKPDRAFHEFITALRESDQNHVANIIDKNRESTPKNKRDGRKNVDLSDGEGDHGQTPSTRKRKAGEIGVRLKTERLEYVEEDDEDEVEIIHRKMSRREVESREREKEELKQQLDIKLLTIIKKELQNLENVVGSGISESSMAKRRVVLETLKDLQKYRREITSIDYGSVLFRIVCPTLFSLLELQKLCTSGRLASLAEKIFTVDDLLEHRLRHVHMSATIDPSEFSQCLEELSSKESLGRIDREQENRVPQSGERLQGFKDSSSFKALTVDSKWSVPSSVAEDLCLLKYISLNSPPHKSVAANNLPRLFARETLHGLTPTQRLLVSPSSGNVTDLLHARDFTRGRSPNRHSVRRIDGRSRRRRQRMSLSLSPLPDQHRPCRGGVTTTSRSQPGRLGDGADIRCTHNYTRTMAPSVQQ